ncbi:MAG: metalloregulator ArsR/SmtB family transcription factor [Fimbriimonadaceae bacterium]
MARGSVFAALSEPARRRILGLIGDGERSAGEISALLPLAPSTVSHHLSVLRDAGLVAVRREGKSMFYRLNTTVVQDAVAALLDLLRGQEK